MRNVASFVTAFLKRTIIQDGKKGVGPVRLPPPSPLALTGACNILWTMDIFGVETGEERWRGVAEVGIGGAASRRTVGRKEGLQITL